MDRERAREIWEMIKAYGEGEQLQYRKAPCKSYPDDEFCDMPNNELVCMTFPADDFEYRIKPKPREYWVYDSPGVKLIIERDGPRSQRSGDWIKVREIVECD